MDWLRFDAPSQYVDKRPPPGIPRPIDRGECLAGNELIVSIVPSQCFGSGGHGVASTGSLCLILSSLCLSSGIIVSLLEFTVSFS